jgi:hypothetical protein
LIHSHSDAASLVATVLRYIHSRTPQDLPNLKISLLKEIKTVRLNRERERERTMKSFCKSRHTHKIELFGSLFIQLIRLSKFKATLPFSHKFKQSTLSECHAQVCNDVITLLNIADSLTKDQSLPDAVRSL